VLVKVFTDAGIVGYAAGHSFQRFSALVTEPLTIDAEGYVHVTDKPGLGVELNEEIVERYRTSG